MFASDDPVRAEYAALTFRLRSLEHTGLACWAVSTAAAAALLAWGVQARQPGILLAVAFAAAAGQLPHAHARLEMKRIAAYLEEFVESRGGGAQWFSRVAQLDALTAGGAAHDWVVTATSNLLVLAAVVCAWLYSGHESHGELFAGVATACGLAFAVHSVSETMRLAQCDFAAQWRKAAGPERTRTAHAA